MKIAIDLTVVEDSPAGIGQYTINLVSELLKSDKTNQYFVYTKKTILLPNATNIVIKSPNIPFLRGSIWMYKAAKDMKKRKIDLLISPANFLLSIFFDKTIQYIHDLAPIYYGKFFPIKARIFYRFGLFFIPYKAKSIITISNTIADEIRQYYSKKLIKIDVVEPALNNWFMKSKDPDISIIEKYHLPDDYILTIGTLEPRKNLYHLILGFLQYKENNLDSHLKLLVVGKKGWLYKNMLSDIQNSKFFNDIIFLGYVPNEDLSTIIIKSKGFCYLSYYEGFGIPPLEAMYFDKPILLSNIKIFREIYENSVEYVSPTDIDDIAQGIDSLLYAKINQSKYNKILAKYSWESSAKKLLNIINDSQTT
jgi:glycosyltransferase involved in cell wall biosynthesis